MLKKILTVIVLMLAFNYSQAQVSKIGTSAAPFLQIGVGAKATASGEAFTAISSDANALYWNPAGIESYEQNDVVFNYINYFAGMKFINAGAVLHLEGMGSFGLSVTSFSTPEMVVRTVEEPEGIGTKFDAADMSLGVSYAKSITDNFIFGATAKLINRRIWHMNATAIAMDFGIMYNLPWENIKLGMSILNFGSKLQMQGVDAIVFTDIDPTMGGNNTQVMADLHTKEWSLPLSFRFGLSYKVFDNDFHSLQLASDYIHPNDNFSCVNVGGEYGFMNHFFLRAGYKAIGLNDSEEDLTLGCGVKVDFIGLDYSYVKMKHLDNIQQFSLNLRF